MTDENNQEQLNEEVDTPLQLDEETVIKNRLKQMGVSFHHKLGVEKLRELLNEQMDKNKTPVEDLTTKTINPAYKPKGKSVGEEEAERHRKDKLRKDASKLIRVVVTCMNPAKKEWQGEVLAAGNSVIGTHKKFVPFGVEWHVPNILLTMIRERQFQSFYTVIVDGVKVRRSKMLPEFAVQVLPRLTPKEMQEIERSQRARNASE